MQIIPAIDIIDGKCVRLTKGDYNSQTIYHEDPLEAAKLFEGAGISRLHLVDLDGAKAGAVKNLAVLERIASNTKLLIDFGGGIKKQQDVGDVFNAGAAMVTIGSLAAQQPAILEEWLMEFGPDHFIVGADVMNEQVKISGWLEETGLDIFQLVRNMLAIGVHQVFCTDISKDGMMEGPSVDLYKRIIEEFPDLKFVASGGVTSLDDLELLKAIGCHGVIIGKAIYEGRISLEALEKFNAC
jgi:phosphoribosylformimino-5-aminoimidazole carboxamide ribotide isomerase